MLTILFWSCTKSKITQKEHTTSYQKGKGNRFYGGIFRTNETEYVDGFFPHYIIDPISQRVSNHIFEGLVKYNPQTLC